MIRIFLSFSALIFFSSYTIADSQTTSENDIQWLGWPITGSAYKGMDEGIFANPVFETDVEKDIFIGLRSDGVVIWKKSAKTNLDINSNIETINSLKRKIESLEEEIILLNQKELNLSTEEENRGIHWFRKPPKEKINGNSSN